MLLIYWILRTVPGGGFRRFAPALSMLRAGARGDQEFSEQTVKIVWKRVSPNFGEGSHLGV